MVTDGPANWPAFEVHGAARHEHPAAPRAPVHLAAALPLGLHRERAGVDHVHLGRLGAVSTCPASRSASRMSAASAWLTLQPRKRTAKRVAVLTRPPRRGRRRPRAPGHGHEGRRLGAQDGAGPAPHTGRPAARAAATSPSQKPASGPTTRLTRAGAPPRAARADGSGARLVGRSGSPPRRGSRLTTSRTVPAPAPAAAAPAPDWRAAARATRSRRSRRRRQASGAGHAPRPLGHEQLTSSTPELHGLLDQRCRGAPTRRAPGRGRRGSGRRRDGGLAAVDPHAARGPGRDHHGRPARARPGRSARRRRPGARRTDPRQVVGVGRRERHLVPPARGVAPPGSGRCASCALQQHGRPALVLDLRAPRTGPSGGEGAATPADLVGAHARGDQPAGRGRRQGAGQHRQDGGGEVGRDHVGARGQRGRRRSCGAPPAAPRRCARALASVASTARGSQSTAHTGSKPRRRAAMASTPDPQPASSSGPARGQRRPAAPGRRGWWRAGRCRRPSPGRSRRRASGGARRLPGRAHQQPARDLDRPVEGAHRVAPRVVLGRASHLARRRRARAGARRRPRGRPAGAATQKSSAASPAGPGPLPAARMPSAAQASAIARSASAPADRRSPYSAGRRRRQRKACLRRSKKPSSSR